MSVSKCFKPLGISISLLVIVIFSLILRDVVFSNFLSFPFHKSYHNVADVTESMYGFYFLQNDFIIINSSLTGFRKFVSWVFLSFPRSPKVILWNIIQCQILFLLILFIVDNIIVRISDYFLPPALSNSMRFPPPHATISGALYYDTPLTYYEIVKIAFFSLTGLIWVRMFIVASGLLFTLLLYYIPVRLGFSGIKHPKIFRVIHRLNPLLVTMILFGLGFHTIRVFGRPIARKGCSIVIGNHVCVIETLLLFSLLDNPSFLSRVENFSLPFFKHLTIATNSILVNRLEKDSRSKALQELVKRSKEIDNSSSLMIFPEGTCDNQQALFSFKRGAFESGMPVQMACFRYPYKFFNPAWTGSKHGGNDILMLVIRLLSQFFNRVEIICPPLYHPTCAEQEDSRLYATKAQEVMASTLGIFTSDATLSDY